MMGSKTTLAKDDQSRLRCITFPFVPDGNITMYRMTDGFASRQRADFLPL